MEKESFQDETEQILEILSLIGDSPAQESLAQGITITYAKNGKLLEKSPDGTIKVIGTVPEDISREELRKIGVILPEQPDKS
mgnify:CR=1 FL=1